MEFNTTVQDSNPREEVKAFVSDLVAISKGTEYECDRKGAYEIITDYLRWCYTIKLDELSSSKKNPSLLDVIDSNPDIWHDVREAIQELRPSLKNIRKRG